MAVASDMMDLLDGPPGVSARPFARESASVVDLLGESSYDGAKTFDQLSLWAPPIKSADGEILPAKGRLDARTRDMVRNDAQVNGAATTHKDTIVGSVFLLNAKPMSGILFGREDPVWELEFQEEVETKFTLTAESPECWLDAQRTKTVTDIARMGVGLDLMAGEILGASEWMPDDGRPCRTAYQMIDTDRLSDPLSYVYRRKMRRGVEVDRRGAPIAYHIRMAHPSDYSNPEAYAWRRVMARKPWGRKQILHEFEELRPDQHRGIAAMVSALEDMKMLKGFRKVDLQRAVLAATYAASIESELPQADVFRAMGGEDESSNPSINWMREYLEAINEYAGSANNLMVDGVKIPVFMPGTKLNIKNTGADAPSSEVFERQRLRYIAAALNVSYEQFSRDYSQLNYAGLRVSRGETLQHMSVRKKRTADRVANFIYRNWLEERINYNDLECLKRRRVPAFYQGLNAEAYANAEWIGAGAGLIDPLKETQALVLQLKNGLATKEQVTARLSGGDWRAVAKQIAREMAQDKKLGIPSVYTLGATDSENALSGSPQEREPRNDQ